MDSELPQYGPSCPGSADPSPTRTSSRRRRAGGRSLAFGPRRGLPRGHYRQFGDRPREPFKNDEKDKKGEEGIKGETFWTQSSRSPMARPPGTHSGRSVRARPTGSLSWRSMRARPSGTQSWRSVLEAFLDPECRSVREAFWNPELAQSVGKAFWNPELQQRAGKALWTLERKQSVDKAFLKPEYHSGRARRIGPRVATAKAFLNPELPQ